MLRMLLNFLRVASGGPGDAEYAVTGYRRPLGYLQIPTANLNTATTMSAGASAPGYPTFPAGFQPHYAVIQCNGGTVRWRDDGTNPTVSVGMSIPDGGELDYVGDITKITFILSTNSPILDISLYE